MNKEKPRKILVTSALMYANGSLHLGHFVEYIQTDIWVRFQKLRGHECLYVCGNDAHGTPIMISAEKKGVTPEELIQSIHYEHIRDANDFYIEFDNFYTTHSEENKVLSNLVYERLKARGDIESRVIKQAFDPEKNMFLPDRYIKGECPKCGAEDQYGDNCEVCGATYSPTELKNPKSTISGATPIEKESEHYFFKLENYEPMLKEWTQSHRLQKAVSAKLNEWFESGLQQWDISRDKPYFGFEIPDHPGKYFYVWLDAPIGYMASFKNLCERNTKLNFDEYWDKNSKTELYHFIGKDITYFHTLFWPAMLEGADFRTPSAVFVHGFLTINGEKMSKSRGTFTNARDYLNHLNPEYLRYYFAAKLSDGVTDIDLNFDDFVTRVNSDLVGKVVNIASRCAGFITKKFNGELASKLDAPELFNEYVDEADTIAEYFESRQFSSAVRDIMALADKANQYIDAKKPWVLAKEAGKEAEVQAVCTMGLNLYRQLIIYLKPILPKIAENSERFLNIDPLNWKDISTPLLNHTIQPFTPLIQRVDSANVKAMLSKNERED